MKRRAFFTTATLAGAAAACTDKTEPQKPSSQVPFLQGAIPSSLGGVPLDLLHEYYRHRLMNEYLPFWEIGGFDNEYGGFMCAVRDNGMPVSGEKRLMWQGQALWVYSFLYTNLGGDPRHLEIASMTRDFMVSRMHDETTGWRGVTARDGSPADRPADGDTVIALLMAAEGLAESYKADKRDDILKLVLETVWSAMRVYDEPTWAGIVLPAPHAPAPRMQAAPSAPLDSLIAASPGDSFAIAAAADSLTSPAAPLRQTVAAPDTALTRERPVLKGIRTLTHSRRITSLAYTILSTIRNRKIDELLTGHVSFIMNNFFNPSLGITNEYLTHSYDRMSDRADEMLAGSSLASLEVVLLEAIRANDARLFTDAQNLVLRYIDMAWDPVFDGIGDGWFYVFDGPGHDRSRLWGTKTHATHCSAMSALLSIIEYTGETWAVEWYDRVRAYATRTFDTESSLPRQAVDRFGGPLIQDPANMFVRDIYHLPRHLMLDMLCLDRMIAADGRAAALGR